MAKLKVELERTDWEVLARLAQQGFSDVFARFALQLNTAAQPQAPQPPANGEDKHDGPRDSI
jgi:hypothetical protein